MKTVIHVYYQNIKRDNSDNDVPSWGLGDCIRGTITLYRLSKILNFNLIVDLRHHPISSFIKINNHPYNDIIDNNIDNLKFFFFLGNLQKYIEESFNNNDIAFLHTNSIWDLNEIKNTDTVNSLSIDEQEFIKNIFIPTENFNNFMNNKLSNINFDYNIIHFRCGDERSFNLENLLDNDLLKFEEIFNKYYESNDILISDNKIFKNYIKSKYNVIVFDTEIGHTGFQNDINMIEGTLFDFFIQNKSKKIKSFTMHNHISGFMLWNAKVYNIPILIMN
jgi:hypothetical protein